MTLWDFAPDYVTVVNLVRDGVPDGFYDVGAEPKLLDLLSYSIFHD